MAHKYKEPSSIEKFENELYDQEEPKTKESDDEDSNIKSSDDELDFDNFRIGYPNEFQIQKYDNKIYNEKILDQIFNELWNKLKIEMETEPNYEKLIDFLSNFGYFQVFGGYLRDRYEEKYYEYKVQSKDVDLLASDSFIENLYNFINYVPKYITLSNKEEIEDYGGVVKIIFKFGENIFHFDMVNQNHYPVCDFLCNCLIEKIVINKKGYVEKKIMMRKVNNDEGDISIEKQEEIENKLYNKCLNDIKLKNLTPIFPKDYIKGKFNFNKFSKETLEYYESDDKQKFTKQLENLYNGQLIIKMIIRTQKMMSRGWILQPHISGKEFKFSSIYEKQKLQCAWCNGNIKDFEGVRLVCTHAYHTKCLYENKIKKCYMCVDYIDF